MILVAKNKIAKIAQILLAVTVVLLASSRLAEAATGTVDVKLAKVGAFVGLGRATGTLHFEGRKYRLYISGITAGTIGVGFTHLRGHAYNLRRASDIGGNYTAASVSVAVVGGIKVARLQNVYNIVYLQLEGPQAGFEVSVAAGGVSIEIVWDRSTANAGVDATEIHLGQFNPK